MKLALSWSLRPNPTFRQMFCSRWKRFEITSLRPTKQPKIRLLLNAGLRRLATIILLLSKELPTLNRMHQTWISRTLFSCFCYCSATKVGFELVEDSSNLIFSGCSALAVILKPIFTFVLSFLPIGNRWPKKNTHYLLSLKKAKKDMDTGDIIDAKNDETVSIVYCNNLKPYFRTTCSTSTTILIMSLHFCSLRLSESLTCIAATGSQTI